MRLNNLYLHSSLLNKVNILQLLLNHNNITLGLYEAPKKIYRI